MIYISGNTPTIEMIKRGKMVEIKDIAIQHNLENSSLKILTIERSIVQSLERTYRKKT